MPLCFAYYCSGHGYGHATRVSAFACHLLSLPPKDKPIVYIISSAPKHVFADSIARGAVYRYAEIDPVIVQPLAYRVDRQKSVDVLKQFLSKKDILLHAERQWLIDIQAHAVLSDAAFLGCLAAKAAGIPSILITNFTFDSVYSYLSSSVLDVLSPQQQYPQASGPYSTLDGFPELIPDIPVPPSDLTPLVKQLHTGYRCADMLLLLPGHIPIPSFSMYPSLPSYDWVDPSSNEFHPHIVQCLGEASSRNLYPSIPFASPRNKIILRSVIPAPLIVRPPTPSIYTLEGRSRFLSYVGVPSELHNPIRTKILVVSFGGQVFRTPSRPASRLQSRVWSSSSSPDLPENRTGSPTSAISGLGIGNLIPGLYPPSQISSPDICNSKSSLPIITRLTDDELHSVTSPRLATPSHLWIPGAPPASKLLASSPSNFSIPTLSTIPPTPDGTGNFKGDTTGDVEEATLLPDASWIAIVCGVTKEQSLALDDDQDSGLPNGFFVAPKDVYMPDLTAIGDVLALLQGYGTVSECVDSCTPFVYVSRPLFIEEHGLRLLLSREGVGVELSRQSYEAGDWATAVEEAWKKGKSRKRTAEVGIESGIRQTEGREMAKTVVHWTTDWYMTCVDE